MLILVKKVIHNLPLHFANNLIIAFCVLSLTTMQNCISHKDLVYMQGSGIKKDTLINYDNPNGIYRLQTDDVLSIIVKSLDSDNSNVFNLEKERTVVNVSSGYTFLNGYSVDTDGNIHLPVIGNLHVRDLTVQETQSLIQTEVDSLLNDATVLVNLVSYKISVLGEVQSPGQFYIYNNRLNIFEAISMAGDLKDFANRRRVNLIRQKPGGSIATSVDLTDGNLINSPYFYLKPNDVLYVEPLKQKSPRINLTNLQILTALFTGISTFTTVIVLIRR